MKYFGIIAVFSIYLYVIKKHQDVVSLLPISKQRMINLNKFVNAQPHKGSLYVLYVKIMFILISIIVLSLMLKLSKLNIFYLVLIIVALFPLVIVWNVNHLANLNEFTVINTYLTQFILIFKSHSKVLFTLEELKDSLSGNPRLIVSKMIADIETGKSLDDALSRMSDAYPHFIIHNLHSLVVSVERYGSIDYYEALDLIQDDIDDWFDDINLYNHEKKKLISKVLIFIGFAFTICYIALKMLVSIDISYNTPLYQTTLFIFCLAQVLTYVGASTILNEKMIHESESL